MFAKMYFFIIIINFLIEKYSTEKTLKVFEDWDDYIISIDGMFYKCPECIPYKIRSNNGTISLSLPRIYNYLYIKETPVISTFISLRTEFDNDHYWVTWPFEQYVAAKDSHKNFKYRIFSVMGFDIDSSQNYYLLDQGVILQENNTIMQNTSKLVVFNRNGKLLDVYYFNYTDFTTSFLTDIVVDQNKKYAYITDSGILLNDQSIPRIIVIDLKEQKIYRILNNNTNFIPDENITIKYSDNEVYNYFTNITGLNNIQITCDGKMIIFSSLKSKMIFRVYIKDINKAIKNYEKTQNEDYLNDIPVTVANKGIMTQSFYISSKNNIYMTNGEKGTIQALYSLDEDIKNYNFKDFSEIQSQKFIINWPSSIDIDNGKLYLLDNHYYERNSSNIDNNAKKPNINNYIGGNEGKNESDNETETVGKYVIYEAKLEVDELSHTIGCSLYVLKFNLYNILIFFWFFIICVVIIFVMVVKKEKKKKNKINEENEEEDEENDENVKELNRRLNEDEYENENDE